MRVPGWPGKAELALTKTAGFRDVVLWNLGEAKAPSMSDLGEGEWRKYVCVEAGAIGTPVFVPAGGSFSASQRLSVECV